MADNIIFIDGQEYYLYKTYSEWIDAIRDAKYYKKKVKKNKYFILKAKNNWMGVMPDTVYRLYMTRVATLGSYA